MTISRKIISQWLDISSIKDKEIIIALNSLGFEVEQVRNLVFTNTNLIVGEILRITKHPKSSKLNICEVSLGNKSTNIVCGASNVAVGNKVVVAKIGSTLANGLTITSRTIQDVVSSGMICSLTELGIFGNVQNKDEISGIIHLPSDAVVGNNNPLQYLKLDDTIFFIDLTVNRSDCLGTYSIARELSAYFKTPLRNMGISNLSLLDEKPQVSVVNTKIQALATLKIRLKQNSTKLTPMWIKRTLQLVNIAPKTLVEDVVNLVMLELGQPMITFNAELLKEPSINVSPKSYPEGSLKIEKGDIVIHDKFLAFSVLGVSYKIDYEVKPSTKDIFIFSINPNVQTMIEQVKRHTVINNIFIERLVKPVAPNYYMIALQRYLFILDQLKIEYEILGFSNDIPYNIQEKSLVLNYNDINKILGSCLEIKDIINYLTVIGCKVELDAINHELLKITVPGHRNDLNNTNDLSEEIARIIGYDNLPVVMPVFYTTQKPPTVLETLMGNWRNYLISYGFNQVKTYSLTSKESLTEFNFFNHKNPVSLSSPLTSTREVMRFNLTDSLLKICQYNYARKETQFKIFTDETIYTGDDGDDNHHLGLVVMGDFLPKFSINKSNINPYHVVKGFIDGFLNKVIPSASQNIIYKPNKNIAMHPYLSADIFYEQEHIATIGALHPQTEKQMNFEKIFLAEINCTKLAEIIVASEKNVTKFKPWSKFNPLSRDISAIVGISIQFSDIKFMLLDENIEFLEQIILIDFYTDDHLKSQFQHSLTFNLKFNSSEKQLDEEKIKHSITAAQNLLKNKFNATIR
ncbi:phenylalanine--tRNA ligase subunit beta [Spiroplasma endosymbiont of Nebria brevicollis]|uniref:phenylalanine--tRNA ligase subunit beta n=1 Tax=Spiroplasma endosymbiont of Nebria brevicollis TaxID=3066284 RepID=UPI00313DA649